MGLPTTENVSKNLEVSSGQIGLPGVLSEIRDFPNVDETMARMAQMVALATAKQVLEGHRAQQALALDSRTVREALAAVDEHVLAPEGRVSSKYAGLSRLAIRYACDAIGDVQISDLSLEHVTLVWNLLANRPSANGRVAKKGASLSAYGSALMGRLVDAEKLGFVGMKRFREMFPRIPVAARVNIEVSDEIHREAMLCLRWAADHTTTTTTVLRVLEVLHRSPFRADELCSMRNGLLDARAGVVRVERAKGGKPRDVPVTARSIEIIREQIAGLPWDAAFVWPSDAACGHVLASSVSHAWMRLRKAYAQEKKTPLARSLSAVRLHHTRGVLCTQALSHGGQPRDVQRALGHACSKTMERYEHGTTMAGAVASIQRVEDVLDRRVG